MSAPSVLPRLQLAGVLGLLLYALGLCGRSEAVSGETDARPAVIAGLHSALTAAQTSGPKVYVYPPPANHSFSHIDCSRTHHNSAHAWESLFPEQLATLQNHHADPATADLFLLATNISCYIHVSLSVAHEHNKNISREDAYDAVYRLYLKPYVQSISQAPSFQKRNASDHVVILATERGVCGFPPQLAQLLGDALVLQAGGIVEGRPTKAINPDFPRTGCYLPDRHIVVPPYHADIAAHPAATAASIGGTAAAASDADGSQQPPLAPFQARSVLAYYSGPIAKPGPGYLDVAAGTLQMLQVMAQREHNVKAGLRVHTDSPPIGTRLAQLNNTRYCLCPLSAVTYTPWPPVCLAAGSVPVLLADGAGQPFERLLPYRNFTLKVDQGNVVHMVRLLQFFEKPNMKLLEERQALGRALLPHLLWSGDPRVNAAAMVVLELACRRGWPAGGALAAQHCKAPPPPVAFDAWV